MLFLLALLILVLKDTLSDEALGVFVVVAIIELLAELTSITSIIKLTIVSCPL